MASNLFCVMLSQTADISHEQLTSNTDYSTSLACYGTEHSQAVSRSVVLTTYVTIEPPGEVGFQWGITSMKKEKQWAIVETNGERRGLESFIEASEG